MSLKLLIEENLMYPSLKLDLLIITAMTTECLDEILKEGARNLKDDLKALTENPSEIMIDLEEIITKDHYNPLNKTLIYT